MTIQKSTGNVVALPELVLVETDAAVAALMHRHTGARSRAPGVALGRGWPVVQAEMCSRPPPGSCRTPRVSRSCASRCVAVLRFSVGRPRESLIVAGHLVGETSAMGCEHRRLDSGFVSGPSGWPRPSSPSAGRQLAAGHVLSAVPAVARVRASREAKRFMTPSGRALKREA